MLDLSLLYILMLQTHSRFARRTHFLALGVCFPGRSPDRSLAAGLPCQDHVYITTDKSFRFYNNKLDEMPCELDATENPRSFKKCPTPPAHQASGGAQFSPGAAARNRGWTRGPTDWSIFFHFSWDRTSHTSDLTRRSDIVEVQAISKRGDVRSQKKWKKRGKRGRLW